HAIAADVVEEGGERHLTGPYRGTGAAPLEAAALLIGPGDDVDRAAGDDAGVVQGPHALEGGEHAIDAVEPPAGRLAVHMAAGEHRCGVRFSSRPREKEVCRFIGADREPERLRPPDQHGARRDVLIAQRLPGDAATTE